MRNPLLASLKRIASFFSGTGLGRVKPIRRIYNLAYSLFRPPFVRVQGHLMWLDDKDVLELATNEFYEPTETEFLKKHLKKNSVFIDIGANIGYYSLLSARQVGSRGKVYAFEPDPDNFRLLEKNIQQNGYLNVVLTNFAVSDHPSSARLYRSKTNYGDHRIYDSEDQRESIAILATSLDDYFEKLDKRVHFIKMDIQGAEAKALEGMRKLVKANRRLTLIAEFCGKNLKKCGSDPGLFLSTLLKLGFKISEISEKEGSIKPTTSESLLVRFNTETDDYTNLLCSKGR